jgi:hypothetical protein
MEPKEDTFRKEPYHANSAGGHGSAKGQDSAGPSTTSSETSLNLDGALCPKSDSVVGADPDQEIQQLLVRFPFLKVLRSEGAWCISSASLQGVRALLGVSVDETSQEQVNTANGSLFEQLLQYTPTPVKRYVGCGVRELELSNQTDETQTTVPNLISTALLRKMDYSGYADFLEDKTVQIDMSGIFDTMDREATFAQKFADAVEVRRFGIIPPEGVCLDRSQCGPILSMTTTQIVKEDFNATHDKVGQRATVSELNIEGLHQPEFADIRGLTQKGCALRFTGINFADFPREFIETATPGKPRVLLFEDTTQGFAVINDGEKVFLHSDNKRVQDLISFYELDRGNLPLDTFPGALDEFLKQLTTRAIPFYHLEGHEQSTGRNAAYENVVSMILAHDDELYVKSTRTSSGAMIVNVARDDDGQPIIFSESKEVTKYLSFIAPLISSSSESSAPPTETTNPFLKKLTMQGFLEELVSKMEFPIVERAIPVMRLITEQGSEKIEYRMILQGRDTLEVAGHYAKASTKLVAANISLGGTGRKTRETLEGLYRQYLATENPSQELITSKVDTSYEQLVQIANVLGNRYATEKRAKGKVGSKNLQDFAIDICPVWDDTTKSIQFHLLEIQYSYAYSGLEHAEPEMAAEVTKFRKQLEERIRLLNERAKNAPDQSAALRNMIGL